MKWYYWLSLSVAVVLGICTAIPVESSSKACFLGYKALCPFTPISTLICLAVAVVIYLVGKKHNKKRKIEIS